MLMLRSTTPSSKLPPCFHLWTHVVPPVCLTWGLLKGELAWRIVQHQGIPPSSAVINQPKSWRRRKRWWTFFFFFLLPLCPRVLVLSQPIERVSHRFKLLPAILKAFQFVWSCWYFHTEERQTCVNAWDVFEGMCLYIFFSPSCPSLTPNLLFVSSAQLGVCPPVCC